MKQQQFDAMGLRWAKIELAAGEALPRHNHAEDHLMLVAAGRVRVVTDVASRELSSSDSPVLFRAPRAHAIEALTDAVIFNVFGGAQ